MEVCDYSTVFLHETNLVAYSSCISTIYAKTVAPMNVKLCRVLETPLNVLEMLKVVYIVFTWLPKQLL